MLVNCFQMPAEFRNPVTYKRNHFLVTGKGWDTLTFVASISFLDANGLLPYTKRTTKVTSLIVVA